MIFPSIKHDMMDDIAKAVKDALKEAGLYEEGHADINIEIPNDKSNGDFSTNAAFIYAKKAGMPPGKLAVMIIEKIDTSGTYIEKVEAAGPGFINFHLSKAYLYEGLKNILRAKEDYGKLDIGRGEKVMVEFVSANPTGPLHMGNARGGALGDLIASVLETAGYDVTREFLINDAGNQIYNFGRSLEARYIQYFKGEDSVSMPEDGYMGEDIIRHACEFAKQYGDSLLSGPEDVRIGRLAEYALTKNLESIKRALESYGIVYDNWFSEQGSIIDSGELDETIRFLDEKGYTYEKDGAKWFRTTMFGSDKDDVLVKNNGLTTYFASDIAYHRNKFIKRRFYKAINLLGADHHGHAERMVPACRALGIEDGRLEIIVYQLVRLMRNNEVARMSKRTGRTISLEDLIEEVGRDAVRFFFNMKASGSHLDFDIDLAAKQSNENPVFYVQYAHARICSMLRKIEQDPHAADGDADLTILASDEELKLIDRLTDYPEEIRICVNTLEPSRLTRYAIDIASLFHSFYNACRVIGEDDSVFLARLKLVVAVKTVLGNVLKLMKISAPERM